MSLGTQANFLRGTVTVSYPSNVKLANLSMPTLGTEYSYALQANVKQVIIRARVKANTQFSFTASESGTTFFTIPKGTNMVLDGFQLVAETLYFQSDVSFQVLEIIEFY